MGSKKSKTFFLFFLVLSLGAATLHANTDGPNVFWWNPGAVTAHPLLAGQSKSTDLPTSWHTTGYGPALGNGFWTILAGVAGNVVGMYGGAMLGSSSYQGILLGGIVGSTCGSSLGVYIAGSSGGRGGNFGSAMLGSLLGELAAAALACVLPSKGDSEFAFLPGFLILPPIGAAILFNRSQGSSSFQAGRGFLNLAEGKLGLAVPDVQVRPLSIPGVSAKPEMQFNVRVLSVEL